MHLTKKDKKAIRNIAISLFSLLFAYIFYLWLKTNDQLRQLIFDPALNTSNWVTLIIFVAWFGILFWVYKKKKNTRKWKYLTSGTMKIIYSVAFSLLSFWLIFFIVDFIATNTSLTSLLNMLLQLDIVSGLFVFGIWFVFIVYLVKQQKKK